MTLVQAIILAIIEGLTEFLPVSSTGHMIIGSSVMGIASQPFTKTFTVVIQFGAILSVMVLYWKRFLVKIDSDFYKRLFIAFVPAVIFGLIFKKQIDQLLENVLVVAVTLLTGGILFLLLDPWIQRSEKKGKDELKSDASAFKIGLFQVIAMVPGVSRSAATIIGGLTQGLNKRAAAEFSFFLAVPTMFAATCKDVYEVYSEGPGFTVDEIYLLLAGNLVAFIVAMLAIRTFINFLTRHGFRLFGWYRIGVGLLLILLHLLGIELSYI